MKQFLFLSIAAICAAAWAIHGVPNSSSASSAAATAPAPRQARMTREQYAEALRKNAPVREKLARQYPDSYRELEQHARRDLNGCVVTQLIDGMLKAACQ